MSLDRNEFKKENNNNNKMNNPRNMNDQNQPLSVRNFADDIGSKLKNLNQYTIKGQLVDPREILNQKNRTTSFYASLRDEKEECRVSIKIFDKTTADLDPNIKEGDLVVVTATVAFMNKRGELYLKATKIKLFGIGELYKKIEELKIKLRAEGLFDPSRKKKLPFIPRCVGLITGKGSMGIHDVQDNTERR
jgi:exodeoxyribonuclease VII large subunit